MYILIIKDSTAILVRTFSPRSSHYVPAAHTVGRHTRLGEELTTAIPLTDQHFANRGKSNPVRTRLVCTIVVLVGGAGTLAAHGSMYAIKVPGWCANTCLECPRGTHMMCAHSTCMAVS